MGKPNISLLATPTLFSSAFNISNTDGFLLLSFYVVILLLLAFSLLSSRFGLTLRALGDNPHLLQRIGTPVEKYRLLDLASLIPLRLRVALQRKSLVMLMWAGFGMTLTGIGAIILGQQILSKIYKRPYFRIGAELIAAFIGVLLYFFSLNFLYA